jgi:hypothetical protein
MNATLRLMALLAMSLTASLAQAASNAEDCKKEGGVWRESATMGGFCFKKLASDGSVAPPDRGGPDLGSEKANHNTARSNKATVAKPADNPPADKSTGKRP